METMKYWSWILTQGYHSLAKSWIYHSIPLRLHSKKTGLKMGMNFRGLKKENENITSFGLKKGQCLENPQKFHE